MERVNIGIIGVGKFGLVHLKTLEILSQANIYALSSRRQAYGQSLADKYAAKLYTDYHDMLTDPKVDAVIICVPPDVQPGLAIETLAAGKHVFLEKPVAVDLKDGLAIDEASQKESKVAMVGYPERFNPSMRRVKDLITHGHIGKVYKVSSRRASRFTGKSEWAFARVGMMIHIAGHDVDLVRWMMDDEVRSVYAIGGSYLRKVEGQYDNLCMLLKMQNDGIAVVEESWTLPSMFPTEENDTRMDVLGTQGNLIVNNLNQTITMCNESQGVVYPGILRWPGGINEPSSLVSFAMKDEMAHFIECIHGRSEPIVTVKDACLTLQVLLAGVESLKTDRPVEIPSL
jgi:UDP-N-acetylglucosamine 3-dehydrogenase